MNASDLPGFRAQRWYKLVDHEVVPVRGLLEWARWFETADHRVAVTGVGPMAVSTIFLGVDHRHFGRGPPLLFETMIRAGEAEILEIVKGKKRLIEQMLDYQERYSTWDEAMKGHEAAVAWARRLLAKIDAGIKLTPDAADRGRK